MFRIKKSPPRSDVLDHELLRQAISKMSLFRPTPDARELLQGIASISGIPLSSLMHAERRMAASGSLTPLKELLTSPAVPKAEKLRFKVGLTQARQRQQEAAEAVKSSFTLKIKTLRGMIEMRLDLSIRRQGPGEQQLAKIVIHYALISGTMKKTYKQAVVITGNQESTQQSVGNKDRHSTANHTNTNPQISINARSIRAAIAA